ncbi:MAG: YggT family protein [Dehalococcoidia bacterium]
MTIIVMLVTALYWAIIARVIIGWFPNTFPPDHPITRLLYNITEPILAPIRKMVYRGGPFDLSPMIAIIFLLLVSIALGGGGLF